VERFLEGSLDFPGIWRLVEEAVERFDAAGRPEPDLEELVAFDAEVRAWCHTRAMRRPAREGGAS